MSGRTRVAGHVARHGGLAAAIAERAHWRLRAGLASVFLYHGIAQFALTRVASFAGMMGLPLPVAYLVAAAETLAGAGILAGSAVRGGLGDLATRLAGRAIVPVMLGAIAMGHWGQWSLVVTASHPMGGMEFQVLLLLTGLYLALRGNEA